MPKLIADAHAELAAVLEAVLPGRVHPYRPDRNGVAVVPLIWVDRVDTASTSTAAGPATEVAATIVATVDGASHAAQRLRADLHAAIHDATIAAAWTWAGATCTTFDANTDTTLLSLDAVVTRNIYAVTFCTPVPPAVPIPKPTPVEV